MKNSEYWQKRFELLEASQINKGIEFNHDLKKQYEIAKAYIQGRIADFYMRFAENNKLDNLADTKKLLKKDELEEFKWTVYEYIDNAKAHGADKDWIKKLENASIKARVSRLEYIEMQIQQQAELLTALKAGGVKKLLTDVYYDKYIKTAYEISKGLGVGLEVYGLNTETVEKIITKPWAPDGSNFSERIWGSHRAQLINSLKTQLSQSIIRGNGPKEAIEIISKLFNVDYNKASNLVQTELAFFSSAAQKNMFDELNVEKYEIVATLDLRTSEICQEMDGKIFNEKDYEGGVTAPPFHCRCRSTTCPYFDDEFTVDETRVARDPVTGKTVTVPGNIKYKEWKEKCLKASNDDRFKNYAKADEVFNAYDVPENSIITPQSIQDELKKSEIGYDTLKYIEEHELRPKLVYDEQWHTNRGDQHRDSINIYVTNISNDVVAAQTVIHEITHYRYGIGNCQWAEAVCMAKEKMHIVNRNYLTMEEKRYIVGLARKHYGEYNWRKGGTKYGRHL